MLHVRFVAHAWTSDDADDVARLLVCFFESQERLGDLDELAEAAKIGWFDVWYVTHVCVGKWCPFRGVALLGQGVDDEDDNTD